MFSILTALSTPYPWLTLCIPLLAVILDYCIGDPNNWPHPVRIIGRALHRLEKLCRRSVNYLEKHNLQAQDKNRFEFFFGCATVLLLCATTGLICYLLLSLPWFFALCASLYLSYTGLALGSLLKEGEKALTALEADDLPKARQLIGYLVSRDTSTLEKEALQRALAESLAENYNDGFVAPLFWLLLGGPIFLWIYKVSSTMDSMWGYRTPAWAYLGKAAARVDDILAWIPARLAAVFFWLTAYLQGGKIDWPGFALLKKQSKSMESPNAGWPMASIAWLLQGTMGGATLYAGVWQQKPLLGPENSPWTTAKLRQLLQHLRRSALLTTGVLWAIYATLAFFL